MRILNEKCDVAQKTTSHFSLIIRVIFILLYGETYIL